MPSKTNELERAAAMGIDVSLLLESLARTPAERLQRNTEANQLLERSRRVNFTPEQLERLRQREIEELKANWGSWLDPLDAL